MDFMFYDKLIGHIRPGVRFSAIIFHIDAVMCFFFLYLSFVRLQQNKKEMSKSPTEKRMKEWSEKKKIYEI